jgi:hypothetical protein
LTNSIEYGTIRYNQEREKTMINYVVAENGGIKMFAGVGNVNSGNLKGWANTAEGVAYTLNTCGIAEKIMGHKSMNFASKEGFKTDDGAMLLLKRALELV